MYSKKTALLRFFTTIKCSIYYWELEGSAEGFHHCCLMRAILSTAFFRLYYFNSVPHWEQKMAPGVRLVPHWGQNLFSVGSSAPLPNKAPSPRPEKLAPIITPSSLSAFWWTLSLTTLPPAKSPPLVSTWRSPSPLNAILIDCFFWNCVPQRWHVAPLPWERSWIYTAVPSRFEKIRIECGLVYLYFSTAFRATENYIFLFNSWHLILSLDSD